jgi:hypothetical protein
MELIEIKGDKVPALTCDAATLEGCNEKEKAFVAQVAAFSADKVKAELKRLSGMKSSSMKPELAAWLDRRLAILKQVDGAGKQDL